MEIFVMSGRADREQISVPLTAELRAAIARVAEREQRSTAAQVRLWVIEALAATADRQSGARAA
jgi:hypothetical protein